MVVSQMLLAQVAGGGYVSIAKIIPPLLILLVWARLLTWADQDAPDAHLPRNSINAGMLGGLVLAYALFFLMPSFWIGLPILLVCLGAEVATYLHIRNKKVGLKDLRRKWDNYLAKFSKKRQAKAAPGQVTLIGKNGQPVPVPEADAPDRPVYDAAQAALTDPMKKNAEQVDLDSRTESGTSVKYVVDGVSYSGPVIDRTAGAGAISYLKGVAGMDVAERRKPQTGSLKLAIDGVKRDARVQTSGNTAGEYLRLQIDPKKRHDLKLDQLGFSEAQLALVRQTIDDNKGVVLLSTPAGMGLTNLLYGVLRGHDAFIQHLQTVERDPEEDLEGVTQNKLEANAPAAEELKTTDWVISQEPDAILVNRIEDPRTAAELIRYAAEKRVYVGFRAGSTFEALAKWRKLVGDDRLAVQALTMVINGRVLRKLCNNCKVGYTPDPATLRKLGMNPEKVTQLFQARTQALRDQKGNPVPCTFCQDLRYVGRTGVFEIMVVDDEMRQAIAGGKSVEQAFRKNRGRFLQEEALAMVQKGDTSVQEVKRVLKPEAAAAAPPAAPRRTSSAPVQKA